MGQSWSVVCRGDEALVDILAEMLRDEGVDVRGRGAGPGPEHARSEKNRRRVLRRDDERDELDEFDEWLRVVRGGTEDVAPAAAVTLFCHGPYGAVMTAVSRFGAERGAAAQVTVEPRTHSPRHAK